MIDEPETDLWGNVIEAPLIPRKNTPNRIQKRPTIMHGPLAEKCGTCAHLVSHTSSPKKRFFKCALAWNGNRSEASDIRKKHPACAKWTPKPQTP